jgi:hypothetical protein
MNVYASLYFDTLAHLIHTLPSKVVILDRRAQEFEALEGA